MLHQTAVQTLALTEGAEIKGWILAVVGNLFAAFLGVRALGHFLKKEWGEMVTLFVAAVFVAGIVWFPDGVKSLLSGIWGKVAGSA
ncbi:TcpD family membrane protein [Streptomyces sp. NPDC001568]|uniref:TcpD family membrane protein n=1 Tax=Streptomyces sp. NPDC001568 TaxID=3364588 RepID=UPI0036C9F7E1